MQSRATECCAIQDTCVTATFIFDDNTQYLSLLMASNAMLHCPNLPNMQYSLLKAAQYAI